jgi:predicted anti-sigma-YlaC factor YlaD
MTTEKIFHTLVDARISVFGVLLLLLTSCSLRQTAANLIGDALSGGGGVYLTDDDPELIREALPFGLKMFESLLEVSPEHRGLLIAAAKGFTAYAYLIQDRADRQDENDMRAAERLHQRSRGLYLRGRDYALRGLETNHPGFTSALRDNREAALKRTKIDDVPFLYWAGAAWAGAVAVAKNDPDLLVNLPTAGALVARVLELDEGFDFGAAHEFFVSFEAGRPGGSADKARSHYRQALEFSRGERASVHVALAESVALRQQNLAEFRKLTQAALAVKVEKFPQARLTNALAEQRARWLQSRIHELFLDSETVQEESK